jgi:hypothetical protein
MKKLVIILLTLFTVASTQAQQKYVVKVQSQGGAKLPISDTSAMLAPYMLFSQGIVSLANNTSNDSLVYYVGNVRHAIKVASTVDLTPFYKKTSVDSIAAAIRSEIPTNNTQLVNGKGYITSVDIAGKLDKSDSTLANRITANFNLLGDRYTKAQVDSISAKIRDEIQVAASGGITQAQLDDSLNNVKNLIPTNNNQLINGVNYITAAAITGKVNVSDTANMLVPYATDVDLNNKVDKVTGKQLSTNDYTTVEKNKLAAITGTNTGDQDLSGLLPKTDTANMLKPYTTLAKTKADSITLQNSIATKQPLGDYALTDDLGPAFTSSSFDTTSRALKLTRIDGTFESVVIPKGTASGAEGISALSSSRTGNMTTIQGDNGTTTEFSVNDADSATRAHLSDLANYVPKTTTVNGKALSTNIVISATDINTGTLPHAQLPPLVSGDIPNIAESQVTNLVSDLAAKATLVNNTFSGSQTINGNITYNNAVNSQGDFLTIDTSKNIRRRTPTQVLSDINALSSSLPLINWDSAINQNKASLLSSSVGSPASGSTYHGFYFPQSTAGYGSEIAFRNNAFYFRSKENGTILPWLQVADRDWSTSTFYPKTGNPSGFLTLADSVTIATRARLQKSVDSLGALISGQVAGVSSVNGKTGAVTLTPTDINLGNVNNTSDISKPISTATQTALDLKAPLAAPTFTGTVNLSDLNVYGASKSTITVRRSGVPTSASMWDYTGGVMQFGTTGNDGFNFITNGTTRMSMSANSSVVTFGTSTDPGTIVLNALPDTPTLGVVSKAPFSITTGSNTRLLTAGIYGATGASYFQTRRTIDANATYPLLLNPLGGNVGINKLAPTEALDVTGNIKGATFIADVLNVNAPTVTEKANIKGGILIQNNAGATAFRVRGSDGQISMGSYNAGFNIGYNTTGSDMAGSMLYFTPPDKYDNVGTSGVGILAMGRNNSVNTAVNSFVFQVADQMTGSYAPTSGSLERTYLSVKGTINQTGTANGITRGLWIDPTLTAAADYRAIELSNNSGKGIYQTGTAENQFSGNITAPRIYTTVFGDPVSKNNWMVSTGTWPNITTTFGNAAGTNTINLVVKSGGSITANNKVSYTFNPTMTVADSLVHTNKKYVDSSNALKQDVLVSGTSIKTLNGQSLLGSGNISITAGTGSNNADSLSGQPGSYYASVTNLNLKADKASPTFTGTVVLPTTTSIGTITSTELGYVDGVTSSIQTQLDSKLATTTAASTYAAKATTLAGYGITDALTAATAASTYAPISHTHTFASLTSKPTTLSGFGITDALTAATAASTYAPISTTATKQALADSMAKEQTLTLGRGLSADATTGAIRIDSVEMRSFMTNNSSAISGGGTYTLPIASATVLGGVKIGTGLSINSTTGVLTATATGSMPSLQNRNYANDSIAMVDGGLALWDYYRTGNIVKVVSQSYTPAPVGTDTALTFTIDNTGGGNLTPVFRLGAQSDLIAFTVDWGDGATTNYSGANNYNSITHTYATTGTYNVSVHNWTNRRSVNVFSATGYDNVNISNISTNINDMLPGLQFATLISNRFTTANVNAWKFGTALTQLDLSYNALSYFHPTNALPATLTLLDLTNTGLNTGEIDNTLIYLDGLTFNAGAKTLNITQSVPTPPTSTGLAAITSLQSKGWTVNYDAAPTVFNYTIDNTDGTSADQSIRMDGWSGNFSVTVNWGDGSSNTYGDAADYTMTHTYATNSKFTATFTSATPALINEVYVNQTGTQKNITAVGAVTYLTGLNRLQLNKINMANVNSLALPTTLKNYIILALPITTFDPVAALPALNNLTVQTTDITAFAPTQGLPATLTNLDISANKFNATGVNNALIYIDSKTFNAGGKILNVKTYNAANAPTGSGLTAKNNLTAEGWSVTSD